MFSYIFLECVDGFYNASCTEECGHCLYAEICNKVNGHCPSGCTSNFIAPLCQGKLKTYTDAYAFYKNLGLSIIRINFKKIIIRYFIEKILYLISMLVAIIGYGIHCLKTIII